MIETFPCAECCGDGTECEHCPDAAQQFQVTGDGIPSATVDYASLCSWEGDYSGPCGASFVEVSVASGGTGAGLVASVIFFDLANDTIVAWYESDGSTPFDCSGANEIPLFVNSSECEYPETLIVQPV